MKFFGLLLMLAGIITLILGEIFIVTEEKLGNIDLEQSEPIAWAVYAGIAALVTGVLFVLSGKRPSSYINRTRPFNDTILNI